MSLDAKDGLDQSFRMAKSPTKSEFKQQFIERTKEARDASGHSQEQIAQGLGIKQDTYKNYEVKRPLPHSLVPRFCAITKRSIEWLYTGKDTGKVRRTAA